MSEPKGSHTTKTKC